VIGNPNINYLETCCPLFCPVKLAEYRYLCFITPLFFLEVKLQQQLTKIKGLVKKFQRELVDVKPTPECEFVLA